MLDLSSWSSGTLKSAQARTLQAQRRAANAWKRINDKPTSVAFKTAAGVTLAAQTVRIEVDNRADTAESDAGQTPRMNVIVYGIRGHATLTDTDIAEGYRFVLNGDEYTIKDVILQIGEIQGVGVANG